MVGVMVSRALLISRMGNGTFLANGSVIYLTIPIFLWKEIDNAPVDPNG